MSAAETAAMITGAAVVGAAAVAGWWQTKLARQARAADQASPLTVVGSEYRALVTVLQGEVARLRVELETLRAECEQRDLIAQHRIAHLEARLGDQP